LALHGTGRLARPAPCAEEGLKAPTKAIAAMPLFAVSLLGAACLAWPLLPGGAPGWTRSLPLVFATLMALLLAELLLRRLDARRLSLLASLVAIECALRLATSADIEGFSPVFFLILCAGYVLGPSFGFLAGALALFMSDLATGLLGPWLPYQVFAAGWLGAGAGLLRRRPGAGPWDVARVAGWGFAGGYLYGAVTDLQTWTFYYQGTPSLGWHSGMSSAELAAAFGRFYIATSLFFDTFRATGNVLLTVILASPVLLALERFRRRFTLEVAA